MVRANAFPLCTSRPRSQRMRVTIGSRPGESGSDDLAGAAPIFEYCARRCMIANFFRDLEFAQRRTTAAWPIAEAEFGCGNWIDGHQVTAIEKS